MKIGALDLGLLAGYLLAVVLFGLWMGRRPQSMADYAVGGRDMPWWVVLFSIVATETSTVTFLSIPGWSYQHDLTWLQLPLGYILGRLLVVGLLLPRLRRGEPFTAYQVLEERFGGAALKRVASVLFLITRNLADGLRLFLTAIVLEQVAGIDLGTAVVCIGVGTIFYTVIGGMRAVLWTDLVQFFVYMAGAAAALWILGERTGPGGWSQILQDAAAAGKLRLFDLDFDLTRPYVLWAGLLGGAFLSLGTHGVDQMMVQRYLCARSQRQAALALGLSGPVVALQFAVFLLVGVALWAFYTAHPPAVPFARADRVFATFIVDEVPPGLLGLLLGAVFSAAMSTLSSSLNSSATTLVHDLYAPLLEPRADPARRLRLTRRFTVVFGVMQIAVGIGGQWTRDAVVNNVLSIAGFTTGIVLGVFFLGVFTTTVRQGAALLGLVGGLAVTSAVVFGTALAWPWFTLVGSLSTLGIGLLASSVSGTFSSKESA